MSISIIILLALAAVIILILMSAAAMSSIYSIRREISINRPQAEVFAFIKHIRNQEKYSKWAMQDPNQRITTTGIDGTVGFVYAWESDNKKVGQGEQIITALSADTISSRVKFIKPFEGEMDGHLSAVPSGDSATQVVWVIGGYRAFGMRIFHLLFKLEKALGKDMAESLGNLKQLLEK